MLAFNQSFVCHLLQRPTNRAHVVAKLLIECLGVGPPAGRHRLPDREFNLGHQVPVDLWEWLFSVLLVFLTDGLSNFIGGDDVGTELGCRPAIVTSPERSTDTPISSAMCPCAKHPSNREIRDALEYLRVSLLS